MSTGHNKKLSIQIESSFRFPVPPPPAGAAEGDRFFSIKAFYFDMTPPHISFVGSPDQSPHILRQSEFFSLGPEIVRRIFSTIGVSLPDDELNLITPPGMAKFTDFLAGNPRAADTVLPLMLKIFHNMPEPPPRPVPAAAAAGDIGRAVRMSLAEAEARVLTVPAKEESIEALEVVKAVSGGRCSVCLEDFDKVKDSSVEKKIVRTPCSHVFHRDCLVRWLRSSHLCPLCRYAVP